MHVIDLNFSGILALLNHFYSSLLKIPFQINELRGRYVDHSVFSLPCLSLLSQVGPVRVQWRLQHSPTNILSLRNFLQTMKPF